MANKGFIALHRKITEWEWYSDTNTFRLFMHLLLKANYVDKKWRGIDVKRGELLTGLNSLSKETGLTIKSIRTALSKLKMTGEVTSKATNKYSIIRLENYSLYQDKENEKGKQNDKRRDVPETNEGQTKGKRRATTNKENNINKENNKIKVPDFLKADLWNDFIESRNKLKAPNSNKAIELVIKKLTEFQKKGIDPNLALENSIENGWKGVFEPKQPGKFNTKPNQSTGVIYASLMNKYENEQNA